MVGSAITGLVAVAAGIALLLARRRVRLLPLYAAALLGTALITSALFFNGHRSDDTELLYMWVGLVCFYFFTWRAATVQAAGVAFAFALYLAVEDHSSAAPLRWVIVVVTVATTGVLVSLLRDRRLSGWLPSSRKALRSPIFDGARPADPAEVELLGAEGGHRALLMVPIVAQGETFGLIEARSFQERPWSATAMNRARIVSAQLGAVLAGLDYSAPVPTGSSERNSSSSALKRAGALHHRHVTRVVEDLHARAVDQPVVLLRR